MVVFAASFTWTSAMKNPEGIYSWVIGGALVGFGLAMVTVFKKAWSPVTGPLYALAEGLLLGGLSAVFERQFPGIVIQAVSLTFGVAFALLLAYTTRLIKPTENFKMGVAAATGGVALVYLTSMVLGLFGVSMPFLHDASPLGIGISIVIVIIAALNLVLDFDFIEQGAEQGAPKYMEWYAAFGLVVTLVWLYLEILRLLSKLQSRN
jgi:uncharacterized YccA/Bax inhibitor family protein